jgi:hypothetical protein
MRLRSVGDDLPVCARQRPMVLIAQKLEACPRRDTVASCARSTITQSTRRRMPPGIDLAVASDRESRHYDEGRKAQRCG